MNFDWLSDGEDQITRWMREWSVASGVPTKHLGRSLDLPEPTDDPHNPAIWVAYLWDLGGQFENLQMCPTPEVELQIDIHIQPDASRSRLVAVRKALLVFLASQADVVPQNVSVTPMGEVDIEVDDAGTWHVENVTFMFKMG